MKTLQPMSEKQRMKSGFYWVKLNNAWTISFYANGPMRFHIIGKTYTYTESELDEIDRREIENPNTIEKS